jgi:molecular chaperone GrpE
LLEVEPHAPAAEAVAVAESAKAAATDVVADEVEKAKRRIARDAERAAEMRVRGVLTSFIDVVDDLDRALGASSSGGASDGSGGDRALREGIELVRDRFLSKLAEQGVEREEPIGAAFDPNRHEAVAAVRARSPAEAGRVERVLRPGYRVGEEVLRPASVVVTT